MFDYRLLWVHSDLEMYAESHAARRDRKTKATATNSKPQLQKVPGATKIMAIDSATKTRPITAKIRRRLRLWSFMYTSPGVGAAKQRCSGLRRAFR